MKWFLRSRSKAPAKAVARKAAKEPWDPKRTLAGLKLLAAVVLLAALAAGGRALERSLSRYVEGRTARALSPRDVELADAPEWMADWLREDLQRLAAAPLGPSVLDAAGLRQAERALAQSAWVERVIELQRLPDQRLRVRARYRQPVAVVASRHGYHLVTAQGVRLPGLYLEHQLAELRLPVLKGVTAEPFAVGEVWPGAELQAGLELIRFLAGEAYFAQIQAFEVGGQDERGRLRLVLRTQAGGAVVWGLPAGEDQALEPAAEVKRERLRRLYSQRGAIDAGGQLVFLNKARVFEQRPEPPTQIGYTALP